MNALIRAICVELHCGTLSGTLSLSSLALFDYVSLIDNTIIYGLVWDLSTATPGSHFLFFSGVTKSSSMIELYKTPNFGIFVKLGVLFFHWLFPIFQRNWVKTTLKALAPGRKYERIQGFTKSSRLGFIGLTLKDIQPI